MINTKERLEKVLEHADASYNSFSKNIGLKRSQNLYDIRDGKVKNISFELASLITVKFPEISRTWLLTGDGDMLLKKETDHLNVDNIVDELITQLKERLKDKEDTIKDKNDIIKLLRDQMAIKSSKKDPDINIRTI